MSEDARRVVGPSMIRWLYHALAREDWDRASRERDAPGSESGFTPESLAREGFVHTSYRDAIAESARLYLPKVPLAVLQIDPRRVKARIEVAQTPRGPMPHVHGAIAWDAIVRVWDLEKLEGAPDTV